jgi:hypothetical protein
MLAEAWFGPNMFFVVTEKLELGEAGRGARVRLNA